MYQVGSNVPHPANLFVDLVVHPAKPPAGSGAFGEIALAGPAFVA